MKTREEAILAVLMGHRGQDNGISADALAEETGIPEREVRRIIAVNSTKWCDEHDVMPLSSPRWGFYLATDAEQAVMIDQELARKTAAHVNRLERHRYMMRKLGLGALIEEVA
jgi:hypothetical protein